MRGGSLTQREVRQVVSCALAARGVYARCPAASSGRLLRAISKRHCVLLHVSCERWMLLVVCAIASWWG